MKHIANKSILEIQRIILYTHLRLYVHVIFFFTFLDIICICRCFTQKTVSYMFLNVRHLPAFLPNSPSSSACVPVRGRSTISIVTTSDRASSLVHMTRPGKRGTLLFSHRFLSTHPLRVCDSRLLVPFMNFGKKNIVSPPFTLGKEQNDCLYKYFV